MDKQEKELNHVINMMYRQLGKDLYEDLKNDKVNIHHYKNKSKRIDNVIKAIRTLEINMDNLDDVDMKVVIAPEMDDEGYYMYKFCPSCNAGNNPEATHCIRCEAEMG